MAARKSRRPSRGALVRRWGVVLLAVLIGYAYYHPLQSWLERRHELSSRRSEVRQLAAQKRELQQRLGVSTGSEALTREARRLGYIRPGEHLFIVKGIQAWRRAHRTSIDGDGK